jgi:hypothetical protein
MIEARVWSWPFWSGKLKSGTRSPTWGPSWETSILVRVGVDVGAYTIHVSPMINVAITMIISFLDIRILSMRTGCSLP